MTRKHAGGVVPAGHPLPLDDLWVRACRVIVTLSTRCYSSSPEGFPEGEGRERESLLLIDAKIRGGRRLHAAWISGSALHLESLAPSVFLAISFLQDKVFHFNFWIHYSEMCCEILEKNFNKRCRNWEFFFFCES